MRFFTFMVENMRCSRKYYSSSFNLFNCPSKIECHMGSITICVGPSLFVTWPNWQNQYLPIKQRWMSSLDWFWVVCIHPLWWILYNTTFMRYLYHTWMGDDSSYIWALFNFSHSLPCKGRSKGLVWYTKISLLFHHTTIVHLFWSNFEHNIISNLFCTNCNTHL